MLPASRPTCLATRTRERQGPEPKCWKFLDTGTGNHQHVSLVSHTGTAVAGGKERMMLFVTSVLTQAQGKSAELGLMAMLLRRHNRRCLWRLPEQTIRDSSAMEIKSMPQQLRTSLAPQRKRGELDRGNKTSAASASPLAPIRKNPCSDQRQETGEKQGTSSVPS